MRDSIHRYFRIGTLQWMSYPSTPQVQAIRSIAHDSDFDVVEISGGLDETERAEVKKLACESGISLCCGAHSRLLNGNLNPNSLDESERLKAERALLDAIDEAAYLGAGAVAFLSRQWTAEHKREAFDRLLTTTVRLCEYAAERDITIELEVFDYDMDKCSLIGPSEYAAEFAAAVRKRYRNFGLIADLSHLPLTRETSEYAIRTMRPYLTHFHIGNAVVKQGCEAYGDKHPRFGFPNSVNFCREMLEFLRVLRREGFFDPDRPYVLSFEVKPWNDEDPASVMASSKRVLNRAWALLED